MPEIDQPTRHRINFDEHPNPPYCQVNWPETTVSVCLEQVTEGASVWSRREPADPVAITVSLTDDRLQTVGPRAVALRLPAGDPPDPGTYELVAELTHDGETVQWPPTPRRVTFK